MNKPLRSGSYSFQDLLSVDVRSLALLRICLATLLLIDLARRSQNLYAHYTDAGVMPRSVLLDDFSSPWAWSLHFMNGQLIFQALLFCLAACGALALLVGYRTQLATLFSWALLLSLHNRNWMILNGGDIELRLLLFWSIFLPLGAAFSIDRALNTSPEPPPQRVFSAASIALILQICFVYWFAALLKDHPVWWEEGSATYYALSIDYFRTAFGSFLLNFPALLTVATFAALWIELLGPFLVFIPFKSAFFRTTAILLFGGLHMGFAAGLHLYQFPFVGATAWLALIPSEVWDALGKRWQLDQTAKIAIYYDQDCGFCKKVVYLIRTFFILPGVTITPAQLHPDVYSLMSAMNSWVVRGIDRQDYFRFDGITYLASCSPLMRGTVPLLEWRPMATAGNRLYQWIANHRRVASRLTRPLKFRALQTDLSRSQQFFIAIALATVTLWNLNSVNPDRFPVPGEVRAFARVLGINQEWDLFAPYPTKLDGWFVIPGTLQDGREVDIHAGGKPVSWEKPDNIPATYGNTRWRKYLTRIITDKGEDYRLHYGRYLCRSWNATHSGGDYLTRFEIYFMLERSLPPGETPSIERRNLWQHQCSPQKK